jgi:ferredoxin-NADP reductase
MHVVFDHAEPVARDITTFYFRPQRPVHYMAGQFTEVYLPHAADSRGERRWFTLSSSPTEELLAITTRTAATDSSTYKKGLAQLQPGVELHLAEPMGDFVLPKDPSIPLVFVAAGLGVTPVRSMVKYLSDTGEQRHIRLLYATSHSTDAPFMSLFTAYHLELTRLVRHPEAGYAGLAGSVTTERVLGLAEDLEEPYIYVSGPEPLVEATYKGLIAHGLPNERLIMDYFPGYPQF